MKVIKAIWHMDDDEELLDDIVYLNNNEEVEEKIKREIEILEGDDYFDGGVNIVSWKIISNSYQDYIKGKLM